MHANNGKPRYEYEIHIGVPSDAVWNALADGNMTQHYAFGTRFVGNLTKGAPYVFIGERSERAVDGEILEVTPRKRLVLSWSAHWDADVDRDPPSRVTYELDATSPTTTRLRLTHDQFETETATFVGSVSSWPLMLSSLKTLLEMGKPLAAA
jgi:uncharacterized protein YndB with AHSA1/START domain